MTANDECNLIVIRAEHNKNYKTIDLTCVNDPRLSWKAKGIFNYLTTRPPLWQSKMHDLINKSPEGMSALNSGIKELIKYGYVFRIVKRTNSSVIKWGYLTSEIPCSKEKIENLIPDGYKLYEYKALCENPLVEKALVEKALVEKALVENRIVYNNKEKESNKEKTNNENFKETSSKEEVSETDVSHPASSKLHKRSKGQMLMSAKLSVKPLKEKKPVKPYEASSKAEHLMKYWKGKDLYLPKIETKSYQNALISFDKLLSGKAFNGTEFDNYENKKIDIKDIRKAIDRFAYMALNPDYEPREINFKQSLSKMTPTDFIFNPYFKTNNGYGRSKFINCLENEPKLIREKDVFVEDKYPITSKKVANQFKERILGGADIKFTNGDINDFRKAANFATDLFKSNQGRLMGSYANMEPFRIVNCLFEALESSGADLKKVKPHWLCNSVMQKQLPQYLYQSAIFQDIDCSAKEKAPHYYNFGEPFRG